MSEVDGEQQGLWKMYTATLVAGTIAIKTQFSEVYQVTVIQTDGSPVTEGFDVQKALQTDGTVTVTILSSVGASVSPLEVGIRGLR